MTRAMRSSRAASRGSWADITDPTDIMLRLPVRVGFYRDGITFAESGGAILYDNIIESLAAHVAAHRAPRGCRRL